MTEYALQVSNLSKEYQIGQLDPYKSLREIVMRSIARSVNRLRSPQDSNASLQASQTLNALYDVSFDVKHGEVVGIIGGNGAGKSTLLKILSRITAPTSGHAEVRGRVGSLLEVGTGFHAELTGRENIYLNGAILGMKRAEIKSKFDEIVDFAEIERFLDTPVKRYSSGMYVRLAFAVAAHLEPEILLIDEVLAVGDVAFQKKCLGKMESVGKEGRTILFVSHNMAAVEKLCQRSVVLHQGEVVFSGTQHEGIAHYLKATDSETNIIDESVKRIGTGEIKLAKIEICDSLGQPLAAATSGQDIELRFYFKTMPEIELTNVLMSVQVKTELNTPVFLHHNRLTAADFGPIQGQGFFRCSIDRLPLPPGNYRFDCHIMHNMGFEGTFYDQIDDAGAMTVIDGDYYGAGEVPSMPYGVCLVDAEWDTELT